jgi:polysaccharide biosynthesis transport protein
MTTLPQTTPMRLPRPSGPSQLAVPTAPAGMPVAPGTQMTGGDIWRVIRANLWLIILITGVAALGGWKLNDYLARYYSTYTSTGLLRVLAVESTNPLNPNGSGIDPQALNIEKNSEVQLILSDGLINNVLSDSTNPIRDTSWWKVTCESTPRKAHEFLAEKLSATSQLDSQIIKVTVSAPVAKDTEVIVNSIADEAIKEKLQFIQEKTKSDRQRMVEMKNRYETDLRNTTAEVEKKSAELNMEGGNTIGGYSEKEAELSDKVKAQLEMQAQFTSADNAYTTVMQELKQGQIPPRVTELVDSDPIVVNLRNTIDQLDISIDEHKVKLGESNPMIKELQSDRDLYQQKLENATAQKTSEMTERMKTDLATERDNAKKSLDSIDDQVKEVKNEMAELSNKAASYFSLKEEQQSYREMVQQYEKGIAELDQMVRQQDFGSLAWAQRPQEPDTPSFPKLPQTMGAAIAVGLLLSLGIAFLREITDTSVRSPRDIQRVGQMNLLGMVPHEADDPQASGARLPLVIFEAPHSMMAENFRQVRTRLQHAASLDTTRSILVTSPSPGDGKSTVACNLAAGLALNGRRILLVDSNFRRPELHRIFGIGNEAGFSDVLNDINNFSTTVHETSVPNLSVMPSGVKPSNPTELMESQLLLDFIERALEEFDHVIFDSGPMLFVSESVALAPRVDGVVTVVRARSNSRGVLQRMRDGLRAVKAEHLGVVLNGVRSQAGGYYGRSIKTYYEYQNG